MAQPNIKEQIISGPLANVSVAYRNRDYVADRVFPIMDGADPKVKITKYLKGASMRSALAVLALAGLLAGCAATRSTFDVQPPPAQAASVKGFVKLVDVKDVRQFEAAPRNPSVPSLQDPKEIGNPAITSRAIARKRGGFGNALADILLPEGRTVEQLVREAVTKALGDKGYAVVDAGSAEYERALPLQVYIQQFWAWFTPGAFQVSVEFEGILLLRGDALVDSKDERVRGYAIVKGMVASDTEWREVMKLGVADLVLKTKSVVKAAE